MSGTVTEKLSHHEKDTTVADPSAQIAVSNASVVSKVGFRNSEGDSLKKLPPKKKVVASTESGVVSFLRNQTQEDSLTSSDSGDAKLAISEESRLTNEEQDIIQYLYQRNRYAQQFSSHLQPSINNDIRSIRLRALSSAATASNIALASNEQMLARLEHRNMSERILSDLRLFRSVDPYTDLYRSRGLLDVYPNAREAAFGFHAIHSSIQPALGMRIPERNAMLGLNPATSLPLQNSSLWAENNSLNSSTNGPSCTTSSPHGPGCTQDIRRKQKSYLLYMDCDDECLSEYQCLIRKHMELFEAEEEESEFTRNRFMIAGNVGIRCRHCAHLPLRKRAKHAIFFPTKLERVYQAAQSLAVFHLIGGCNFVPQDVRQRIALLRERKSPAGGGKRYWGEGLRALGVSETPSGLRFR